MTVAARTTPQRVKQCGDLFAATLDRGQQLPHLH
jgi:hypothetical protein